MNESDGNFFKRMGVFRNRYVWLIIGVLVVIGVTRMRNLDSPLLGWHDFRQTQTAISAYWMTQEGISLWSYQTPLFGPPWTVPFEFPFYQAVVAIVANFGVQMDAACRIVNIGFFSGSIILVLLILIRAGFPGFPIVMTAVFAVMSPFSIFWSRASMMEYTAVFLGIGYVLLFWMVADRFSRFKRPNVDFILLSIAAAVIGSLAIGVKVTSFIFVVPGLLVIIVSKVIHLTDLSVSATVDESGDKSRWRVNVQCGGVMGVLAGLVSYGLVRKVFVISIVLIIPAVFLLVWTHHADVLKSYEGASWLQSWALSGWNHGTINQRLELVNYVTIINRIGTLMLPGFTGFIAIIGLIGIFQLTGYVRWVLLSCVGGTLGAILVFFNLYVVHDYYLCAISPAIWIIAAWGCHVIGQVYKTNIWKLIVGLTVSVYLSMVTYASDYIYISYNSPKDHPFHQLMDRVQFRVPSGQAIAVVGDDWNSKVAYYSRRKAIMLKTFPIKDFLVKVRSCGVEWAVIANSSLEEFRVQFNNNYASGRLEIADTVNDSGMVLAKFHWGFEGDVGK